MSAEGGVTRKVVLDTNVILFDALAITKFRDSDIIIPFSVIEEVDRFKRDLGENGRNARHFSRFIDVLRSQGPLANGVLLEKSNCHVYVSTDIHLEGPVLRIKNIANRPGEIRKLPVEIISSLQVFPGSVFVFNHR